MLLDTRAVPHMAPGMREATNAVTPQAGSGHLAVLPQSSEAEATTACALLHRHKQPRGPILNCVVIAVRLGLKERDRLAIGRHSMQRPRLADTVENMRPRDHVR